MNDRRKFRGKRVDGGGWVYGSLLECTLLNKGKRYICEQNDIIHCHIDDDGSVYDNTYDFGSWHEVIPETVGQYTGLKDKNGVEVYEGDIVHMIEVTALTNYEYTTDIKWEDGAFVMKSGDSDYDTFLSAWFGDGNNSYTLFEVEVIGSIHDNPELLEVQP